MKLYYAYDGQKVTNSVQEDYAKIDNWKLMHPDYILQEDVGRDNSILKQVDGVISVDEDIVAEKAKQAQIQQLKQVREEALNSNTVTINGYTFDARPKDLSNIQLGIDKGETLWPDVNDYMVDVTTADLTKLLTDGIAQGEVIWDDYKQAVKAIQ